MSRVHDLRKLCGEFLSIPPTSLILNEELLEEALISECMRIALHHSQRELHILSLKNWVLRKLRCIISDIVTQENDKFNNVLKDGKGPKMEFVGDIIPLSRGYYIPAPTRVVNVDKSNWILISGYPTKLFIELGFEINIEGMCRMIINAKETDFIQQNIPIQSFEKYVGIDDTIIKPEEYLKKLIKTEETIEWSGQREMDAYEGEPHLREWGFDYWGQNPLSIQLSTGDTSFWREKREWNQYDYWLKIRKKITYSQPQLKTIDGIKYWITDEYLDKGIRVHPSKYKQICIALDHMAGKLRIAEFIIGNETTKIKMSFSPPGPIIRCLHAIGARWEGYSKGTINWKINNHAVDKTKKIMEAIGLKVVKKKWGR